MFDKKETRYWGYRGLQANILQTGMDFSLGSSLPTDEEPEETFVFSKKILSDEDRLSKKSDLLK